MRSFIFDNTEIQSDSILTVGYDDRYDVITTFTWRVFLRVYGKASLSEAVPTQKAARDRVREILSYIED